MKRLFASMLAFSIVLTSCGKSDPPITPEDNPGTPEIPVTPVTPDPPAQTKSISVLAIGNSFSVDAMQYLYDILKEDGAEEIVLGNLYIGGCSLSTHSGHFTSNDDSYTYYKNTTGTWSTSASYKPLDALRERDWNYITMQQASGDSGMPDTYEPYIDNILTIVKEYCPNAEVVWHMTWAYQGNSTHSSFPKYGSNQMTMYNAILNAVNTKVLTRANYKKVIPSGTAVQNLRTSVYGDNVTRDGYHMSYDAGRYVTALTWAGSLFGTDPQSISWHPSQYTYTDDQLSSIKEAAVNALKDPYKVTASSYPYVALPADADLQELISTAGYNPDNYTQMEIPFTKFGYYNSSNATFISKMYNHQTSTASNLDDFCTTPIYEKKDIPNGSLIVVKPGFQYRPEGWITLDKANNSSTRPGNVTTTVVKVNDTWWGSWNYRAFNLLTNPRKTLTEETAAEVCKSFGIFIPKQ